MNNELNKLKDIGRNISNVELLEIERFLLYVTEMSEKHQFSRNEKMSMALSYHRLWWFREKQIKRYATKKDVFTKLPPYIFPEFEGTAKIDINTVLSLHKNFVDSVILPKLFIDDISTTRNFLTKKDKQNNTEQDFYITQKGDEFFYKGNRLGRLSKGADYYKVFCALYSRLPQGGEIKYKDLISEIESRIPKTKNIPFIKMRTYIQKKLTERGNGFQKYAELGDTEDNQLPLIKAKRGVAITFNNRRG